MERVLVVVLVATAAAAATTLDEVFLQRHQQDTYQLTNTIYRNILADEILESDLKFGRFSENSTGLLPLTNEILEYIENIQFKILSKLASDLGNVTVQSIVEDVNKRCAPYLQSPIVNLIEEPSNMTCVTFRLVDTLKLKLGMAIKAGLQKSSRDCIQQRLDLCKVVHADCTTDHQQRIRELLTRYIEDLTEEEHTPMGIIEQFLYKSVFCVSESYRITTKFLSFMMKRLSGIPTLDPSAIKTAILSDTFKDYARHLFSDYSTVGSREKSTWGIVKSDAGRVGSLCSSFTDSRGSKQYLLYLYKCFAVNMMQSSIDLLRCAYKDPTLKQRTWSTVPSAYFHSQCLCHAYNGSDCGVKPPQDVDPGLYCLSVLFRDLHRQISYRPAVTYLDYALQTRVPVCQLVELIKVGFSRDCPVYQLKIFENFDFSLKCYLKDLVSDSFNCSESVSVNTYNRTELCTLMLLTNFALCDGSGDVHDPVPYYGAGDSPLVLFLTYLDVTVRVLTLVTYLACPQLRNLPGKLLIGYLSTALLRLLVVRATLADMALAVRLDVASDLASTLWLTCYLHFLTVSIRDLRPPDSLSREEARQVLFRYTLLGWVLPAALSTAFFLMDEAVHFHVQIGQLLFLLCNYVSLFANLYMFFRNCRFYYDVKSSAREFKQGVRKRDVFADIFNFAIKTAVLSGAGITFRLVFTQIQGLEQLLSYYHALGTLQGLLVFLLYGCNREARAFWLRHLQCLRRRNNPA